jgi:phage gpG-like protein
MVEWSIRYIHQDINPNLQDAMPDVEQIMLKSVQLNLTMGGRPRFKVKNKNNETPLVGTGKMYHGVKGEHTGTSARVFVDPSVVSKRGFYYPRALNDGADVPAVEGKLMVFEIDGHTVFTFRRKAFKLGAFPFVLFQQQDKVRIKQTLRNFIFSAKQVTFSS